VSDRAHTDADLVARYLAGEVAAFDELMRFHEGRVFAVCLRMLRDREAALDATQETFITVFRKVDRFAGRSAFSTWLYRVAVNTCHDTLRRLHRTRAEALPENADPADPGALDEFDSADLRPTIASALTELPAEFRSAVVLCDAEGLSLQTAAEILEIPIGTVKSRLFRGRRLLADALGNLRLPPNPPNDEEDAQLRP